MKVTWLICSMHPASSCQNFSGRYALEEWYAFTHTTVAYKCNFGLSTTCEALNHAKQNAKDCSVSRLLKPLKVNKSTACCLQILSSTVYSPHTGHKNCAVCSNLYVMSFRWVCGVFTVCDAHVLEPKNSPPLFKCLSTINCAITIVVFN
jgi:hypothetical protein